MNTALAAADDAFAVEPDVLRTVVTGNLSSNDSHYGAGYGFGPVVVEGFEMEGAFFDTGGKMNYWYLQQSGYVTGVFTTDVTAITTASGGQVLLWTDGRFTYTAPVGYTGTDSFSYAIYDTSFAADSAVVTISIGVPVDESPRTEVVETIVSSTIEQSTPQNTAPEAIDDFHRVAHGGVLNGNVLGNDTDADKDTLSVVVPMTIVTKLGGLVSMKADGSFVYTAPSDKIGEDSFSYSASDGNGGSDTATVVIEVTNSGPEAKAETLLVEFGKSGWVDLNDNVSDADGDKLTISSALMVQTTSGGIYSIHEGVLLYTPAVGFVGAETISFTVTDSLGASSTAHVTVTTQPPLNALFGSSSDDAITGTQAGETIFGRDGKDALRGEGGDDSVFGGAGDDSLYGGAGNDFIDGGLGADRAYGGSGQDRFMVRPTSGSSDKIMDFVARDDQLVVSEGDLGIDLPALLDTSYFTTSSAAANPNLGHGRFVHNAGSKSLFWDADADPATANVLLTTFANKVSFGIEDIEVVP
jgi:Ca2+-binding RTX toxin-like protein